MLIARSWFCAEEKVTLSRIAQECDDQDLVELDEKLKLRGALIHLGNDLVENGLIQLKKPAGISRTDIICSLGAQVTTTF